MIRGAGGDGVRVEGSGVGGVPVSGVLDGRAIEVRVWMSGGGLRVGSAGSVCEADLIR